MSERDNEGRFFRSHVRTILQLVVASIAVGAIFSFVGLSPIDFWHGIFDTAQGLIARLGESFTEIATNLAAYLLIGAAIVVPVWLISRLLSSRK